MCLALYLGSSKALPIVPWDPNKPAFHVIELATKAPAVRRLLRYEHVYYVGSYEGCSCAFNYAHELKSVTELRDYLRHALSLVDELEGFACRPGTARPSIKHSVTTSPGGIALPEFLLQENQQLVIRSRKSLRAQRQSMPDVALTRRKRTRVAAPRPN